GVGTIPGVRHFGQTNRLPAASSGAFSFFGQTGQLNRIIALPPDAVYTPGCSALTPLSGAALRNYTRAARPDGIAHFPLIDLAIFSTSSFENLPVIWAMLL